MIKFNNIKIIKYFILYISFALVVFLFQKNFVASDFSISELLINYTGGVTRRGLLGHVFLLISNFTSLSIRTTILLFQASSHLLFLFFLYKVLIKNKKHLNIIDYLCVFSPLFVFYPIAELESLGRKEILIFLSFAYLVSKDAKNFTMTMVVYSIIILPILIFSWEISLLFFPFYFVVFYLRHNCLSFKGFLVIVSIFIPSLISFSFIWFSPLSLGGHKVMCESLQLIDNGCWGASSMLVTATIYFDTFWVNQKAVAANYLTYLIYFLIGFSPLFFTMKETTKKFQKIFLLDNIKHPSLFFLIIFIPVPLIFTFGLDWGRWINILFSLTYMLFLFLRENDFIKIKNIGLHWGKGKIFIIFFICCLSWNPKILLWDDTGSFPHHRSLNKIVKFISSL